MAEATERTEVGGGGAAGGAPGSSLLAENFVARFVRGFWYPFRALGFLLKTPSLWKWCLLPIVINTVLFLAILFLSTYFWSGFLGEWTTEHTTWYWRYLLKIVYVLVLVLGFLVFCVICGFAFALVGTLLAAPFNDLLSQRVEETALDQTRDVPFSLKLMLGDLKHILVGAGIRMGIGLAIFLMLVPLLLVPGGQVVYAVVMTTYAVWFVALEFADYTMSRARLTFWQKTRFAWRFRSTMLGFGSAIYLTLLIPVLGFLCLPISVTGGTLLVLDMGKRHPELLKLPEPPETPKSS